MARQDGFNLRDKICIIKEKKMVESENVCNICEYFDDGLCMLNPPVPMYTRESPERVMESVFKRPPVQPSDWCSCFSNSRVSPLCNHRWEMYEKVVGTRLLLRCRLCGDVKIVKA